MIKLNDLTFAYSGQPPLFEGYSWQAARGESWAVLGPSGCGKSSLLYLLAGLQLPTSGEVQVGGEVLRRPRPRTGLILQDYGLLPWATVRANVRLGLRLRGFYGPDGRHAPRDEVVKDIDQHVGGWLQRLGLEAVAESYPGQISGGQRQRTAIARTLALSPDLLLMDEPFASLDAPTRQDLQDLTMQLRQERGLTLVLVTHAIEEAALLGQRVLVLGRPPHRQLQVIDNPGGGVPAHRGTAAYDQACASLRAALELVT